jgi:hypothetical protein
VAEKLKQFSVGKERLYFFYRFIILPWELEWANKKFLLAEGELSKFCQEHNINIKSFDSSAKLGEALSTVYENEANKSAGVIWFVRKDTKPKDTLRQLRNCFAHGNYTKRQKNKTQCLVIENIDNGTVKAKGVLPLETLRGLVRAASSCGV